MSYRKCFKCGDALSELRPYGPEGADVCFECMTSDPDLEEIAKGNFLDILGENPMILVDQDGNITVASSEEELIDLISQAANKKPPTIH